MNYRKTEGLILGLGRRHRLKRKEIKEVLKRAAPIMRNIDDEIFFKNMERIIFDHHYILLMDGVPIFLDINGEIFPTLLNKQILKCLSSITVDMGTIPHICNGADLMAPGIVKIVGEFQTEAIIVVIDESFSKPIALVKSLYNSHQMLDKRHGKVAMNIHYVGDKFWRVFKHIKRM